MRVKYIFSLKKVNTEGVVVFILFNVEINVIESTKNNDAVLLVVTWSYS